MVNKSQDSTPMDGIGYERRVFHSLLDKENQKIGMKEFLRRQTPSPTNLQTTSSFPPPPASDSEIAKKGVR